MNNPCISVVKDKNIVFSDEKSKSELKITNENLREIERHKVDGCLIKGEESKKCDWLAIIVIPLASEKTLKKEVFIELKGKNVPHAIEQLCVSVEKLSADKKSKKLGYIICTRSPLSSTEIQTQAKKVLRSHNLMLRVKSNHTETVEKLIASLAD